VRDNRTLAIVSMNISQLTAAGVAILFKYLNNKGMTVMEWMLCKSIFVFISSCVFSRILNVDLVKSNSTEDNGLLAWIILRGCVGSICFILYTYAVTVMPLSLMMIIY
jgi:ABC-type thiamin/hydroxymethylpyrimidine transport system permease subunit